MRASDKMPAIMLGSTELNTRRMMESIGVDSVAQFPWQVHEVTNIRHIEEAAV
jgi:hypothetical protein